MRKKILETQYKEILLYKQNVSKKKNWSKTSRCDNRKTLLWIISQLVGLDPYWIAKRPKIIIKPV
jgi:hypothetical protein